MSEVVKRVKSANRRGHTRTFSKCHVFKTSDDIIDVVIVCREINRKYIISAQYVALTQPTSISSALRTPELLQVTLGGLRVSDLSPSVSLKGSRE